MLCLGVRASNLRRFFSIFLAKMTSMYNKSNDKAWKKQIWAVTIHEWSMLGKHRWRTSTGFLSSLVFLEGKIHQCTQVPCSPLSSISERLRAARGSRGFDAEPLHHSFAELPKKRRRRRSGQEKKSDIDINWTVEYRRTCPNTKQKKTKTNKKKSKKSKTVTANGSAWSRKQNQNYDTIPNMVCF